MSQTSLPVFVRVFDNLSAMLKKAEEFALAKKIEPSVLVNARLAPDMFPLAKQIQIASDTVKGCAARLAGIDVPAYADTETTFADLQERIAKTVAFINSIDAGKIDGSEEKAITLKAGSRELNFKGRDYLLNFALPNLFFHVCMAYAILRHNGVEIGKMDYLGKLEEQA